MEVGFTVNLVELKHACRRLVARLADESEVETDFVVFTATGNSLEITIKNSADGLPATIRCPGRARVPCPVFCSLVRALYYYRGKSVNFTFSAGTITISGRTQIRHQRIFVSNGAGEDASAVELGRESDG